MAPSRFQKGQSGNPAGKPRGSRNKKTLALEKLFAGEAEALSRKAIELAKAGDILALRLCLDRIMPVRKDRVVTFDLPTIDGPEDLPKASRALIEAVAGGDLTPAEAADIGKLLDTHARAVEMKDLDERLRKIEGL
jgi:hypothetical protein